MKLPLALVAVLAVLSITVASDGTDPSKRRTGDKQFVGLWEGVDLNDGSKRTVSIVDNDGDGMLEVAARDTFWTLCDGDRGLDLGTGTVEGLIATPLGTGLIAPTLHKVSD